MPTPDAKQFSEQWVNAWNAHDIEAVLEHFHDDVIFTSPVAARVLPETQGVIAGKGALRHYWTTALKSLPDLHFEIVGVYRGESTLVINYRNHLGGLVNEVLTFDEDGKVREGHGAHTWMQTFTYPAAQNDALTVSPLAPSKTVESDSHRPRLAGLHHFGISVADLERSVRFYCDVLGGDLLVAETPEGEDQRRFPGRAAILSLGGQVFDLCEHSSNAGEPFDPVRTGLDHFALEAESLDDLRAWASWLDAHGVARSEIRNVAGDLGTMFDFVDPDGIQIEFAHFRVG